MEVSSVTYTSSVREDGDYCADATLEFRPDGAQPITVRLRIYCGFKAKIVSANREMTWPEQEMVQDVVDTQMRYERNKNRLPTLRRAPNTAMAA